MTLHKHNSAVVLAAPIVCFHCKDFLNMNLAALSAQALITLPSS